MSDEESRMVAAGFRMIADRLVLQSLGFTSDQPMRSAGRLADPYSQGAADGIDIVIQTLRRAADCVEDGPQGRSA